MMMWVWLIITVLVCGLTSSTQARAETPVTYAEAMTGALEANPTLGKARFSVTEAKANLSGSWGGFDPNFELKGGWDQRNQRGFFQGFPFNSESRGWDMGTSITGQAPTGTSYSLSTGIDHDFSTFSTDFGFVQEEETTQDAYTANFGFSITQELLKGVVLSYNLQNVTLAKQRLSVAELTLEKTTQDILFSTAQAYWQWVYLEQVRQISDDSVVVAQEALRVGQLKVELGELAPVEQTRLEAALVQAQSNALDGLNAAQEAADALLLLMGKGPTMEILPATEAGPVPELNIDEEACLTVALAQNYEIRIAEENLETAERERAYARHAKLPSLSATAATGVGSQDPDPKTAYSGLGNSEMNFPYVSVSGVLSIPLGNRVAHSAAVAASAAVKRQQLDLEEFKQSVASQVKSQVRTLLSSQRKVGLADVNHRLASETLSAEEALSEVGRAIQKDVLEARTEVARTQAEAAKARTDYRLAQVELLRLQGQLSPDLP